MPSCLPKELFRGLRACPDPQSTSIYCILLSLTKQNQKTEIPRTKMDPSTTQHGTISNTCVVLKKCQPRPSQGVQSEGLQRDDLQCAGWFGHGDGVQQAMLQQRRNGARLPYHEFHPVYHSNIIRIITGHWFWMSSFWKGYHSGISKSISNPKALHQAIFE